MKRAILLLLFLWGTTTACPADNLYRTVTVTDAKYNSTTISAANPMPVAAGATVYTDSLRVQAAGLFGGQIAIDASTTPIDVSWYTQISFDGEHWSAAASNGSLEGTYTSTGVQDAIRLDVTIPAPLMRFKIVNNGSVDVNITRIRVTTW